MVQSARVQQIVKGDDTVQTHQIMESVAFNAELSREPVELVSTDRATVFYPLEDGTEDVIGYPANPIGSYPTSMISVPTPGNIPAVGVAPSRGTQSFQSGLGRTVRVEVISQKATPTGDTTIGSNVIENISSFANIQIGQTLTAAGFPVNTTIQSFDTVANSITVNNNATATATTVSLSFGTKASYYLINEVDIFERGFPSDLCDTSAGVLSDEPSPPQLNLT